MPTILLLKRAAAILLMICFVLPLSRCERGSTAALVQAVTSGSTAAIQAGTKEPSYEDKYAFRNVSLDEPVTSLLNIAAFFWPLAFMFVALPKLSRGAVTAISLAELALCAGSAYMVFGITFFGELRFGGYLAYLAVALYAAMALAQAVARYRAAASECAKVL